MWLCDLLSDLWHNQPLNEVVEALAPNILVRFLSLLHRGTSLCNTLSTCLRFVQLHSNFRHSLIGHIADVAGTFKSLFLLCSLLPIPHTCLPAAAVYPL